jgi:hypothetical protein
MIPDVNYSALQNDLRDTNVQYAKNENIEDRSTTTTVTDPRQVTPTQTMNGLIGTELLPQENLPMIAAAVHQGLLGHPEHQRLGFPLRRITIHARCMESICHDRYLLMPGHARRASLD